jgi:hypothetical protein
MQIKMRKGGRKRERDIDANRDGKGRERKKQVMWEINK